MRLISEKEAELIMYDIGEVFIKPTVDSCSGQNCRIINIKKGKVNIDGKEKTLSELIEMYGSDFLIQEKVICSDDIRNIYKESVNTFRIITYIWEGDIYHAPSLMRIGRGGAEVDNAHAGGIFIGVSDEGYLREKAFTEFRNSFERHPDTNVLFAGYRIDGFNKVLSTAKTMHARLAQVGVVNWDFTIDSHGDPIIIEANMNLGGSIWLSEMANGCGPFGERLEPILRWIRSEEKRWHV